MKREGGAGCGMGRWKEGQSYDIISSNYDCIYNLNYIE